MHIRPGILVIGLAAWLTAAADRAADDTAVMHFSYPAWFKQTFYDLRDDLTEADAADRRGLLLVFTTRGCSYCHLMLTTTFADPGFAQRLRTGFDVIGLEMFDDGEITDWQGRTLPIKDFAVREGAQFSPTLLFYDLEGRRLLRLVGYYDADRLARALDYLADPAAGRVRFGTWLAQRVNARTDAGRADAGPASAPPPAPLVRLERGGEGGGRPLLLVFERRDCPDCADLRREVLDDPEVRRALAGFEVARLDADDAQTPVATPTGSRTTAAPWMASLGLDRAPALVLFDGGGSPVLRTDAVVRKGRFMNMLGYLESRAHEKGWTYQRYARSESIRRLNEVAPGR